MGTGIVSTRFTYKQALIISQNSYQVRGEQSAGTLTCTMHGILPICINAVPRPKYYNPHLRAYKIQPISVCNGIRREVFVGNDESVVGAFSLSGSKHVHSEI